MDLALIRQLMDQGRDNDSHAKKISGFEDTEDPVERHSLLAISSYLGAIAEMMLAQIEEENAPLDI